MVHRRLPLLTQFLAGLFVVWTMARLSNYVPAYTVSFSALLLLIWAGAVVALWRRPVYSPVLIGLLVFLLLRQSYVCAGTVALFCGTFARTRDLRVCEHAFTFVAFALGVQAGGFLLTLEPTPYTSMLRFSGSLRDPNELAQVVLLCSLPALLATARSRLYWLPLSVGTLAIVASQSRAGVTLWGICLVWTALSAARRRPKRMVWLGALLLLAVWLLSDRFWFRFQRLLSGDDLGQRLELAKIGWQLFLEHPWLGVGNGQFAVHSGGLVAHNLFVEVFAEGGVLLGGVFLLLVALLLRSIVRVASTAPQWAAVSLLTILLSLTGYMDERVLTIGLLFAPLTDATGPGTLREC